MKDFALTASERRETSLHELAAATWTINQELTLTSWGGGRLVAEGVALDIKPGKSVADILRVYRVDGAVLEAHRRALGGVDAELVVEAAGREFKVNLTPLRRSPDQVVGVVGLALEVTAEARESERVRREAAFGRALSTFFGHAVRHKVDGDFYQQALDAALGMVPGVESGSFWLRNDDGTFVAVATFGLEPRALEGVPHTAAALGRADLGNSEGATMRVPVTVRDEAVAYLLLHRSGVGELFDAQEHDFVTLFAGELAAIFDHFAMQNELDEERARLERSVAEYKALAEFSAEIEKIHDTDELVEYGMQRLLRAFKFDTAMFTDVSNGFLHFKRLRGHTTQALSDAVSEPQPLGAGVNGHVAASGEPLYVDDYPAWKDRHEPYMSSGVQSMLALPVHRDGEVLHTLSFATINRRAALDENTVNVASGFVKRLENAFERSHHLDEIRATREATFRSLGVALEFRDLETRGHTDRVVSLSRRFATAVGLGAEQRRALVWGAYLHDIGKVAVPDSILLKPGKLTDEEFDTIRQHTLYGVEMIRDIAFLPTETVAVVRSHHERWDSTGYPDNLASEEIPLLARMFSLVDVYDALTSERPYKRAWTHAEATTELQNQAGKQFDPQLVPMFLTALPVAPV